MNFNLSKPTRNTMKTAIWIIGAIVGVIAIAMIYNYSKKKKVVMPTIVKKSTEGDQEVTITE